MQAVICAQLGIDMIYAPSQKLCAKLPSSEMDNVSNHHNPQKRLQNHQKQIRRQCNGGNWCKTLCCREVEIFIGVYSKLFLTFTQDHRKNYRCDLLASPRSQGIDAECHAPNGIYRGCMNSCKIARYKRKSGFYRANSTGNACIA